jgi:para-nitrobenzyl esterase
MFDFPSSATVPDPHAAELLALRESGSRLRRG